MLRLSGRVTLSRLAWVLALTISSQAAIPLFAQGISNTGVALGDKMATPPTTLPRFPDERVSTITGPLPPEQRVEEGCFLPPLTIVHSALSNAADLNLAPNGKKDYHSACNAIHSQKWPEAERHLRKTVEQNPRYAAGWVTLGQVMQSRQQAEQARSACTQAAAVDPNYLPAQLCLADIAAHGAQWEEVLKFSERAMKLNPSTDPHSYFYAASAYLKLDHLPEAEKNALKAVAIDKENSEARAHFLLAQIYEAKGDSTQELDQLRQYLKLVTDPQDAAMLKKYVADLEAKAAK
jgi:tetratricopeptide (TPR) repeat protein